MSTPYVSPPLENCPICNGEAHFVHSTYDDDINGPIRNWVRVECGVCELSYGDVAFNVECWGKRADNYQATLEQAEREQALRWNTRLLPEGPIDRIRQALRDRNFNDFPGDEKELLESAANVIAEDGMVLLDIQLGGLKGLDLAKDTSRPMVDITPPATLRDRWMYEQGRLAERDPRTPGDMPADAQPVGMFTQDSAGRYHQIPPEVVKYYPNDPATPLYAVPAHVGVTLRRWHDMVNALVTNDFPHNHLRGQSFQEVVARFDAFMKATRSKQ